MDLSDNDCSSVDQDSNPSPDFNDKSYENNKPMTRSRKAALDVNHSSSTKSKNGTSNSPIAKRIRKKRIREKYENQMHSNNTSNNGSFKSSSTSSNVNRQLTPTSYLTKIPPCIPVQIIEKNDNFIIVKFEWKNRILFGTLLDSSKFGWTKNSIFAESLTENNNKIGSDDSDRNSPSSSNTNQPSINSFNEEFICKHPKCGKKFKNNGGLINHQRLLNHKSTESKQDENNDLSNEDNLTTSLSYSANKDKDTAGRYSVDWSYNKNYNKTSASNELNHSQFNSPIYSSIETTINPTRSFLNHPSENSTVDSKQTNTPSSSNNRTYGLLNYSPFTHSNSLTSLQRQTPNSNQIFNPQTTNNLSSNNHMKIYPVSSTSYTQPFSKQPYFVHPNNPYSMFNNQSKAYNSSNEERNNSNRTGFASSQYNCSMENNHNYSQSFNGSYNRNSNNVSSHASNYNNSYQQSLNDRISMNSFRPNSSIPSSNNPYYTHNNHYNYSNPLNNTKNDKPGYPFSNNELSNGGNRSINPAQSNIHSNSRQSLPENKLFNANPDSYGNGVMYNASYKANRKNETMNTNYIKGNHHHQSLNYSSNHDQTFGNNNNINNNNLSSTSNEINSDYGLYTKTNGSQNKLENSI